MSRTTRSLLTSAVALGAVGVLGLGAAGGALAADPVGQASAQAVNISLLNAITVATPLNASVNTGGATVTNNGTNPVSLLGGQSVVTAGALATSTTAQNDGLSFACAGVVQPGAAVSVGTNGTSCTSTGTGGGGVTIDLAGLSGITLPTGIGSVQLRLNAVTAYAANNAGVTSGGANVTGGELFICAGVVLAGNCVGTPVTLPLTIAGGVNQNLVPAITNALTGSAALGALGDTLSNLLTPLLDLRTNVQDVDPATNGFRVTAIHAGVVGNAVASVNLAVASAGPNAVPTPMVSGLGWPLGVGILLLVGVGVLVVRRHRTAVAVPTAAV